MASKRRLRRAEEQKTKRVWCRGKVKHQTIASAAEHAKRLHELDGATMNWFRCVACGALHVGHA